MAGKLRYEGQVGNLQLTIYYLLFGIGIEWCLQIFSDFILFHFYIYHFLIFPVKVRCCLVLVEDRLVAHILSLALFL
jgi:hypothetical protein